MAHLFWVGLGGFFGAIARYLISGWVHRLVSTSPGPGHFPLGTWVVNVLGCFALGALMASLDRGAVSAELRPLLATGVLGALTTFSTFGYETLQLLRAGDIGLALLSVAANVIVGLFAVWLGVAAVEWL